MNLKLEQAFRLWAKSRQDQGGFLPGWHILRGHSAEKPEMPWLSIHASRPVPADDMPDETGVVTAELTFHFASHADDMSLEETQEALRQFDREMADREALILRLNAPESGPDTREVRDLHVYAIHFVAAPDEPANNAWHFQRVFEVIGQDFDPDPV